MPVVSSVDIEAAPTSKPWITPAFGGPKLKPSGGGLVHSYTTDAKTFAEADWVYLQIVVAAYQIHPATAAELAALGPVGSANAQRWTIEGPLSHQPGDPGAGQNCTIKAELATSMSEAPGSDWRDYGPGKYRLRSAKARITITRPSTAYDFRVTRFSLLATRSPSGSRARRCVSYDSIPPGMSRVVVYDFEIDSGATFEIEAGGYMEVLR
jgi:hypothetical protein